MSEAISAAEYWALQKKAPKYGNKRVEVDGVWFASKKEAARYKELLLLEDAGAIEDLRLQPVYVLQPAFRDTQGKKHAAIKYVGDFAYIEVIDPNSVIGSSVVEDTKGGSGTQTAVFLLKQKLFLYRYPNIELRLL